MPFRRLAACCGYLLLKRRIAELMSQLPLELDVEKMVGAALGTQTSGSISTLVSGGPQPGGNGEQAKREWGRGRRGTATIMNGQ
jgi:hypothetical protein